MPILWEIVIKCSLCHSGLTKLSISKKTLKTNSVFPKITFNIQTHKPTTLYKITSIVPWRLPVAVKPYLTLPIKFMQTEIVMLAQLCISFWKDLSFLYLAFFINLESSLSSQNWWENLGKNIIYII